MAEPYIAVILNPHAAGGRAIRKLPAVTEIVQQTTSKFSIYLTGGPGDAWTQAAQLASRGVDRLIAVGGDGTFNEVANGLLEQDAGVPLGVVPAGTGCDLPRTLGIPTSVAAATRLACTSEPERMDVGWAKCADGTERYFLNVAGLGFDAKVAERAARTKLPGPKVSYLAALAISLTSYDNVEVEVTAAGTVIDSRAVFVTIANAQYFGGGFKIAPMADLQDGLLDIAIVGDLSVLELLWQIPSVYRGKHTNHSKFTHFTTDRVTVAARSQALVQVDGELIGEAPATFGINPLSLRIVMGK
jgi:diacylglycerol kinase (ATP)